MLSLAAMVAALPAAERREVIESLTPAQQRGLQYDWKFWARPNQLAPAGDWTFWLLLAGRGFGKTRSGAQWVIEQARKNPGSHGALVAATASDARKTMLSADTREVEGMSGILARDISPPDFTPVYEPSLRQLTWPNGTVATLYTAEEPERLRGPQHHWAWVDEIAAWGSNADAWDQLVFGLRLGNKPQACITTTPRPIKLVRDLLKNPLCAVTRGATYDNRAHLAPAFFESLIRKYEGTRLGRQELLAEVLDDVPGALWTRAMIDAAQTDACGDLMRVVIGVDPAISAVDESDLTGIVAAGQTMTGAGVVLGDYSCKDTPQGWAQRAVNAFWHHQADLIVAEANQGGDMVRATIAMVDPRVPVELVHASRGKIVRAEPIAALYEQGRVRHIRTAGLEQLEDQMCSYAPGAMKKSPDRMDALVWAMWKLFIDVETSGVVIYHDPVQISAY